jgi:hypothetical protein
MTIQGRSALAYPLLARRIFRSGGAQFPIIGAGQRHGDEQAQTHRRRKCLHWGELFCPDPRNLRHQRYWSKPQCRNASKAASPRFLSTRLEVMIVAARS